MVRDVYFWGTPVPKCEPLQGQRLKVVERAPCVNVPPCEGEEKSGIKCP